MNFLAHAHLSGNNSELLFGNFIADAVKGNASLKYKDDVLAGIVCTERLTHLQIHTRFIKKAVIPSGRISGNFRVLWWIFTTTIFWQNSGKCFPIFRWKNILRMYINCFQKGSCYCPTKQKEYSLL